MVHLTYRRRVAAEGNFRKIKIIWVLSLHEINICAYFCISTAEIRTPTRHCHFRLNQKHRHTLETGSSHDMPVH